MSTDKIERKSKKIKVATKGECHPAQIAILCEYCQRGFQSRNKLFAHIKICQRKILQLSREEKEDDEYHYVIYVTGGRVRGKTLGIVEKYSLESNSWEKCPNLLENRGSHGSTAIEGNLYVIGGGGFHSNLHSNEKFNVFLNKWEMLSPMPTSRHALHVVAIGTKIYALGGWVNGSECCAANECFDTSTNVWNKCCPMVIPRRLFGAVAYHGKIYVFGGNISDKEWYTQSSEMYDPSLNDWQSNADLPKKGQCSAVAIDGDDDLSFSSSVTQPTSIFVIIHGIGIYDYSIIENKYYFLNSLPIDQWYGFDVVSAKRDIYLIGGAAQGKWRNVLYKYDVINNQWILMPSMQKERRRCSAAVVKIHPSAHQHMISSHKDHLVSPSPTVKNPWNVHAKVYHSVFSPILSNINRMGIAKLLEYGILPMESSASSRMKVIDVACGTGAMTLPLLDLGYEVVATDYSDEMIHQLQTFAEIPVEQKSRMQCRVQDGQTLSMEEDESYDILTSSYGIFLFSDRISGWNNAKRVLKNNGILIASSWEVGNNESAVGFVNLLLTKVGIVINMNPCCQRETFRSEVESCGFQTIDLLALPYRMEFSSGQMYLDAMFDNPFFSVILSNLTIPEIIDTAFQYFNKQSAEDFLTTPLSFIATTLLYTGKKVSVF